jgi:hypothetical protein
MRQIGQIGEEFRRKEEEKETEETSGNGTQDLCRLA